MVIQATASQILSAGAMDLRITLTDSDAKAIMSVTPNVIFACASGIYPVYEVNPTVVPSVYAVRLNKPLTNSLNSGDTVAFEV